jgi:DNA-binding NarL/FixJ family response regulator
MQERLSPTELKVIKLLSSGDMPHQIATKMHRSGNTISTHLTRIKKKIGARSTIQAAVMWATSTNNADMEYLSWGRPGK